MLKLLVLSKNNTFAQFKKKRINATVIVYKTIGTNRQHCVWIPPWKSTEIPSNTTNESIRKTDYKVNPFKALSTYTDDTKS